MQTHSKQVGMCICLPATITLTCAQLVQDVCKTSLGTLAQSLQSIDLAQQH
jgi:hypothetical protein